MHVTTAFHDLPADSFPFTIEFWAAGVDRRGPATFKAECTEPGHVQIPALGEGVWTRITFPHGAQVVPPAGEDPAAF